MKKPLLVCVLLAAGNFAARCQVKANFTFGKPICGTKTVKFTNTSQNATSFVWFFSPGFSNDPNPTQVFGSFGVYDVMLIASGAGGKKDTLKQQVAVNPLPSFSVSSNPPKICPGQSATFGVGSGLGSYTYLWSPGSTLADSTVAVVTASPMLPTRYQVQVTDTATGCIDSASVFVEVNACKPPKAQFSFAKPPCGTYQVTFTNLSQNLHHCQWKFNLLAGGTDDTSTLNDSQVTYNYGSPGNYKVRLVVFDTTGLYSDTAELNVQAGNPVQAVLYNHDTTVCAGGSFVLAGGGGSSLRWSPPTGLSDSAGATVICTPPYPVTYTLTVSENGCSDTKTITVGTTRIPATTFYADSPCIGQPAAFRLVSSGNISLFTYQVLFGDGDSVSNQLPLHTYALPGSYPGSVRFSFSGCDTTVNRQVKVFDKPLSSHSFEPIELFADNPRIFTHNNSSGATRYVWDFGDGDASSQVEPQHLYTDTGSYTLKLIAINADGCTDTSQSLALVKAILRFIVPDCFTPNRVGPPENETYQIWSNTTLSDFKFSIWNRWGEKVFESRDQNFVWDGTFNGQPVQTGVCIWRMFYRISNEKLSHTEGFLHIAK